MKSLEFESQSLHITYNVHTNLTMLMKTLIFQLYKIKFKIQTFIKKLKSLSALMHVSAIIFL